MSAALETSAHSAADADEPLAAACCNFLNSDYNAGLLCWRWFLSRNSRFSWNSSSCAFCRNLLWISDCLLSSIGHLTLGTCLFTVSASFRGPHIIIRQECDSKSSQATMHQFHEMDSTRWTFETTLIWIQMDGTNPGNQMIISNQWRNVTWSDAWRKTPLFHQLTQEHEVS